MQLAAEKNLGDYDYANQLRMWHDTNYGAQMEEIKKAGLNPALLYGTSGSGGSTIGNGAGAGTVSAGEAPKGGNEILELRQQGIQMQLMEQQRALLEAQTNKTNVEATKIGGVDTTEATTRIQALTQGIENAKAQEILTKAETNLRNLDTAFASGSLQDRLNQVKWNTQQINTINTDHENDTIQDIQETNQA